LKPDSVAATSFLTVRAVINVERDHKYELFCRLKEPLEEVPNRGATRGPRLRACSLPRRRGQNGHVRDSRGKE